MNEWMRRFSIRISAVLGSPWVVLAAVAAGGTLVAAFAHHDFSREALWTMGSWLTVATFVIVVILQGAQNRHDRALHLKLDELLRAVDGARTQMVNLQGLSEAELETLEAEFDRLRTKVGRGVRPAKAAPAGAAHGPASDG